MPELIDARTANSKKFSLGNNRFAVLASVGMLHYKDAQGSWQDIDKDYFEADTGIFTAKFTKLPYMVRIGDDSTRRVYPNRNDLSYWVELGKPFPSMGTPTKSGGYWVWNYPNTVIAVRVGRQAVKFGFRLKNPSAPNSITIPFNSQGISRNGNVLLHSGEVIGYLSRPTAIDINGIERDCQVSFGANDITLSLDTTGLVYPIDVDPTIYVGVSADDGYRSITDSTKTFNTGAYAIWAGASYVTGLQYYYDAFMRFTGVNIPPGAVVTVAYLTLIAQQNDAANTVNTNLLAEDAKNPDAITDYDDYTSRSKTSPAPWDAIGAWTVGTPYQSPSIVNAIQEVVDNQGGTGSALQIFWMNDGSTTGVAYVRRRAAAWDDITYDPPALYFEYTLRPPRHPAINFQDPAIV